jgi:hypothetical protein
MATNDFVVKNGLVVTDAADILSVSDASSSSDTAASIYTAGGVAVAKKAYVGTDLAVGGATTLTGDIAVNGGDVTTNQTTFNLINATAATVNFAGAGTAVNIGAATGTTTINNANTVVTGDLAVNGGDVTTNQATFNLINTTAATVNFAGAGTAVSIGAATGTTTINTPQLRIGGSDTGNFISFRGTTGDQPGSFNHTYIGERIHTASEASELLIFKGNDPAATSGPDRVRVFAGEFRVDTYTSAVTDTFEATGASASALNRLLITSDGNVTISQDLAVNGGDVTTNQTTFNLINATAATVNFAGAGTAVNIGAATGTLTVGNPTLTMTQGVAVNINGANPVIASTNTGTASLFNSDITAINFGHAAAISMGSTTLNTTVRGNLVVDGNTTLGNASADLVTVNADTANVPNSLTFTIDDAIANNVSYPIAIRHTTSGTAANNIGVGLQFVTETAAGVNRAGVNLDAVATSAANGAENFSFVVDTMTTGGTAAQALLVNNNTVTVGASSTATTVNTQLSSNLTVTTGAAGVTSSGGTVTVQGGVGGTTSGAGGAISVFGGEAATSGTGGTATFRAGNATGTNIIGADTLIDAGQGTGTGRSGQIVFRTGPGGASGASRNALTTVLTLTSGGLEIPGNLTVGGNFTVDGLVTTVNSTTMSVDDKNIELGSVVAKGSLQAILATGTAVVTLTTGDTKSLIPGMALTVNTGSGAFGASSIISTVDSLTQFTASVNHSVSGIVTFTAGGATDFTANGGGITIKGATDKTFNWVESTGNWTANTNISAPSLISTVATGTAPFTVASTTKVTNLNADLLDGLDVHTGTNNEVNKIVRTDSNGYIQAGWINTVSGDNGTAAIDRVYASNDGYIRYYTPTNFRTVLDVPTRTGGDASGTWAISISGNAATATTAGAVVNTVAGTASVELVRGNMGDNDQARILVGATATNAGFLEIATADDGTEPIHVRQYSGVFTTLTRTATLLGSDGNTSFPGTVTANGVTLTGNLGTVTSVATSGTVSGLTLTGGTITTSGTITLGGTLAVTASNFASQTANTFLAAPNGAAGVPTFRTIVAADVPTLNQNTTGSATFLTSSNYINQAGSQTSWNLDFQNTPAGATKYGGDVGANTVNGPGGSWWIQQNFRHTNSSNFWGTQVAWGWEDNANKLATRNVISGTFGAWVYYLNSSNVGSYAVTSLVAGGGITISGTTGAVTVSHADTSSQASVDNSNGTVIQDVTLDTYGHVTGLASVDLDLRYLTAEADTLASVTNRGFITRGSSGTFADGSQGTPGLEIYGAGSTNPAYMTFHRPGSYAIKLGLDGTDLKVGGWSMGAVAHRVWHEGNITPLTAEADTLATVTGRGASTATVVTLTGGGRFSAPDDGFYSFTNVDSDSTHYTSRTNRILTSNGANWVADGKDAVIAITRSSAGTTRGQSIGLTLHNENNTINAYSPAITFTAVSNSGSYNSMYAAIMGKKTGANAGVDSNWNKGELHFYAVGDEYVADTPNMVMTGTAIGMNTASPAARLHVVASAAGGIGSVPAGTSAIIDSSTNNYLLFRNTADNGTYSGIAMQDNNMGGYVVFGNAGGGGDQLWIAGYGGGSLQAGSTDSINPAARTTYLSWSASGVGITSGPLTLNSNRLYFASVNDNNHAFNYPGGTFNGQTNGTQFRWYNYLNLFSTSGDISVMHMNDSGNVGIGTTTPTFKLQVNGSFAATTKSFLIDHPTKTGMKLRYGSLEGPENGVYVRGKLVGVDVIELPEYWTGLVHADSITVNLTAAAAGQQLYVERIENNCVYIVNETGKPIDCFYTVYGERKDVDKLVVEID